MKIQERLNKGLQFVNSQLEKCPKSKQPENKVKRLKLPAPMTERDVTYRPLSSRQRLQRPTSIN